MKIDAKNLTITINSNIDEIEVGAIVCYDDGLMAAVMDTDGDSAWIFTENGCIEKAYKMHLTPTGEYTELPELLMLKLQHTEV